jgi:hypothetical protein
MKVFISWSGERSRGVAEALRWWLPKVIQAIQPWMSASDIEKGTRWRSGISRELEKSSIGIICLTRENLESPWIHFEAGALSKQEQNTYVCTYLYGLDPADIKDPLAQFQTTKAQEEDTRRLIYTINNALGEGRLLEAEVDEQFDIWWPKLDERLNALPFVQESRESPRDIREIVGEILELVRFSARAERFSPQELSSVDPRLAGLPGLLPEDARMLVEFFRNLPPYRKSSDEALTASSILKALERYAELTVSTSAPPGDNGESDENTDS